MIIRQYLYYYFCVSFHKEQTTMTSGNSCQSQASYLNTIEEKPNIKAVVSKIIDESAATAAIAQLSAVMTASEGEKFFQCLEQLQKYFLQGYSYLFMTQVHLMRKMMNQFTYLGKELERHQDDETFQFRMMFILSMIAELLKENPKFYYPFTRKFLLTVFSIDCDLLRESPRKNDILPILGIIYENLSRQIKLLQKYGMELQLKFAVLEKYELISEIYTMKIFNKIITNLTNRGIEFKVADFHKYKVLETITNYISKSQLELFMIKMRMTILNLSGSVPKTMLSN